MRAGPATTAQCLQTRTLAHPCPAARTAGPTIALAMGEKGVITRLLAAKYGGHLTFAALSAGRSSAPGQPTIEQLRGLYRFDSQSPATKVYGIVGNPVHHSKSPLIHNSAFSHVGACSLATQANAAFWSCTPAYHIDRWFHCQRMPVQHAGAWCAAATLLLIRPQSLLTRPGARRL